MSNPLTSEQPPAMPMLWYADDEARASGFVSASKAHSSFLQVDPERFISRMWRLGNVADADLIC